MVVVAQLVRASVCGTEGRGFEPHLPPKRMKPDEECHPAFFCIPHILEMWQWECGNGNVDRSIMKLRATVLSI